MLVALVIWAWITKWATHQNRQNRLGNMSSYDTNNGKAWHASGNLSNSFGSSRDGDESVASLLVSAEPDLVAKEDASSSESIRFAVGERHVGFGTHVARQIDPVPFPSKKLQHSGPILIDRDDQDSSELLKDGAWRVG